MQENKWLKTLSPVTILLGAFKRWDILEVLYTFTGVSLGAHFSYSTHSFSNRNKDVYIYVKAFES